MAAIPCLIFLTTSVLVSKGNCSVLRNSWPLNQLIECKTSSDMPRVPACVGLSLDATWFHSLTLVCYKISLTRFAKTYWVLGCRIKSLQDSSAVNPHETLGDIRCETSTRIGTKRLLPWTSTSSVWRTIELLF